MRQRQLKKPLLFRNNSKDDARIADKLVTRQQIAGISTKTQTSLLLIGNWSRKVEDVTTTITMKETRVTLVPVSIVERKDITNPNVPNDPKLKIKEWLHSKRRMKSYSWLKITPGVMNALQSPTPKYVWTMMTILPMTIMNATWPRNRPSWLPTSRRRQLSKIFRLEILGQVATWLTHWMACRGCRNPRP